MKCKPGLVVFLKSGGPAMTIEAIDDNEVWCVWFDGARYNRKAFRPEMLQSRDPAIPRRITLTFRDAQGRPVRPGMPAEASN
jgi:uncharacterized protein YodC (DUF2158 family)